MHNISDDKIHAIKERLKSKVKHEAPSKVSSKMDVIRASFSDIERAFKKGFSHEEVAADISKIGGFDLSVGTLKNYLSRIRKERGKVGESAKRIEYKASKAQQYAGAAVPVVGSASPSQTKPAQAHASGTFNIKPDRTDI